VCLHNTKSGFWEFLNGDRILLIVNTGRLGDFPNGDRVFLAALLGEWGTGPADWLFLIGINS
jgi:hypothetical protein